MSPLSNELENISRMEAILNGNWRAQLLANSLWDFYRHRIYCTLQDANADSGRIRMLGVMGPTQISKLGFSISIPDDDRKADALVHELLHANLIPLGYPRFWLNHDGESQQFCRGGGIINLADHKAMLPVFLALGYSEARFLRESRKLNEFEEQVNTYFERVKESLQQPNAYRQHVENCFSEHGISFELLDRTAILRDLGVC